ncbi:MAG TPA: maleylpyruvate isomerase family mycothiol-dependent enzyme [Acidimicrobiales bacterium]|nr:maleylpyruvate isomerase family mycothiol-dependent enzyme [Acidimicrobiales bacterium]
MAEASGAPGIVAGSSGTDLTAQLSEEWDSLLALGDEIDDADWQRPTPCPGWTVAAQYAHMIGTESMLLGRPNPEVDPGRPEHVRNDIGGFNEVWVAALAGRARKEVLADFADVTKERRAALAAMSEEDFATESWTPVGKADYRRFMQIRVFDCWVHEQDIRDAVGRPGHESGAVAEQSVDEIVRALGFVVGKKVGLAAGQSVTFRLTGPVQRELNVAVVDGRAKVVRTLPDTGGPATTLVLSSSAFTRLACGRVDPGGLLGGTPSGDLGGVEIAGDDELGRRVVSNLAFTI